MSLLGKKDEKVLIADPDKRKEKMVIKLLQRAVVENDWIIVDFVLKKCWNKERIFTITWDRCGSLLHVATERNFPKVIRVLIENGINVDNRNYDGDTSLHIAVRNGLLEIMDLLFESGCNPFIENQNNQQPLDVVIDDKEVKEKLRLYSVRCSRVKMMKNLETWKNIVSEEEKKEELLKKRINKNQTRRKTSAVVTPSKLKRSDSGIISDLDSDKSGNGERQKQTSDKDQTEKSGNISRSLSFSVRDITSQYNSVTAALRKLSTQVKYDVKPSEVSTNQKSVKKDHHKEEKANRKISAAGLKLTSLYGEPKKSKRKKRIDRTQRMSLPLFPVFAPPESYI